MTKDWTRRKFLGAVGAATIGGIGCGGGSSDEGGGDAGGGADAAGDTTAPPSNDTTPPVAKAPNVLLILVDQERYSRWSPSDLSLPAHERIAAMGVSFRRHYANAMPCTPSRSALYTGMHVPNTGMRSNIGFGGQGPMSTDLPTLGTHLQGLGYATAYFGKWHLSEIDAGEDCATPTAQALASYGFTEYSPCGDLPGKVRSGYEDDPTVAKEATSWLGAHGGDEKPWLLAVNFVNPHDIMFYYPGGLAAGSMGFTAPDDPIYKQQWAVELPPTWDEDLSSKPGAHAAYQKAYDTFQHYPDGPVGKELRKKFIETYMNCLSDVDRHIGAVLDALEASPAGKDTIVVFTSDHGEMAFAHGLRGKGPFIYEENNHVPLVIAAPGVQGGRTVDVLSCHVDLVPTVLALCGQPIETTATKVPHLAGVDLSPLLTDPAGPAPRAELLMTFEFGGTMDFPGQNDKAKADTGEARTFLRGMFDGKTKFARYFASDAYHTPATVDELKAKNDLELYDVAKDAEEKANLAATVDDATLETLRKRLNDLVAREVGEDPQPKLDA